MTPRILVPLDGSSLAEGIIPHALAIGRTFRAEMVLLRVIEADPRSIEPFVDSVDWRMRRAEAVAYLDQLADRIRELGLQTESMVAEGRAAETIVEFSRDRRIDLIALSSHGAGGFSEFHLSSTAQKVISRGGVSVLLVCATEGAATHAVEQRYRRVLAPVDCSHRAEWALCLAASIARMEVSELLIAHVVPVPEMARRMPPSREDTELAERVVESNRKVAQAYLDQVTAQLTAPDLVVRPLVIVASQVAQAVQRVADEEHVDLIVLSAHGCSGGERWCYGTVASSLLAHSTTPLLVFQDWPCQTVAPHGSVVGAEANVGNPVMR